MGKPINESYSIPELSNMSGISVRYLTEIFKRGIGAARTNPESVRIKGTFQKDPDMKRFPKSSRLSEEQWGYARLYSFLNKGKTYHTADSDIGRKSGY